MVASGKMVNMVRYQDGELWYATEDGFEFPIPSEDNSTAKDMRIVAGSVVDPTKVKFLDSLHD